MLELLLYFTTHEDEEVQIKAIIGLGILPLISNSVFAIIYCLHLGRSVCFALVPLVICVRFISIVPRFPVHHAPRAHVCAGCEGSV